MMKRVTRGSEQDIRHMIIALLLSSLLGGLFGVSLGIYWGFGIVMTGLCYVFGSMLGAFVAVTFALSRMTPQAQSVKEHTPETAPQFGN